MTTDQTPHRAILTVTVSSRSDGGHYFDQADFAAHVTEWVRAALKGKHAVDEVAVAPAAVPVPPPADRATLRVQIAEALYTHNHPGWATRYSDLDQDERDTYLARADAVLAVLPEQTDRATLSDAERTMLTYALDQAQERIWSEGGFTAEDQAAVDSLRRLAAEQPTNTETPASTAPLAAGLPRIQGNCPACRRASLFLGAGGYPTCSNADCTEPDAATTVLEQYANEAHPPSHTWKVESPRRDTWASWGTTYDDREWAAERYEEAVRHYATRPYRLVRATTTYTVESEHQPDTKPQDAPPREPHPTQADVDHALAVLATFRGHAPERPAVVEQPDTQTREA